MNIGGHRPSSVSYINLRADMDSTLCVLLLRVALTVD